LDGALSACGGKWDRKVGGHVFDEDPTDLIESIIETGRYDKPEKPENFGFFPTPNELVREMIAVADLAPNMRCLEPSSGIGNIVTEMAAIVGMENVTTIELQAEKCKVLRSLGFNPIQS